MPLVPPVIRMVLPVIRMDLVPCRIRIVRPA
jgi:hypothetical protein